RPPGDARRRGRVARRSHLTRRRDDGRGRGVRPGRLRAGPRAVVKRARSLVLPLLVVAYAAVYLCRANVEPAFAVLAAVHRYDNERVGVVFSLALAAYALGKVVLGPVGDVVGGKRILVFAMAASGAISLVAGLVDWPARLGPDSGLVVLGAIVVANRFVQAG